MWIWAYGDQWARTAEEGEHIEEEDEGVVIEVQVV